MKPKKEESKKPVSSPSAEARYRIKNLKEAIQSVPYYDETGALKYLSLRIQGRGDHVPVLNETQITDAMRRLQKRKLILIERI